MSQIKPQRFIPPMPAFPRTYTADGHNGMTLRDYFAGQALSGITSATRAGDGGSQSSNAPSYIARQAYALADAMLAARE